jgi:hypothetical protein
MERRKALSSQGLKNKGKVPWWNSHPPTPTSCLGTRQELTTVRHFMGSCCVGSIITTFKTEAKTFPGETEEQTHRHLGLEEIQNGCQGTRHISPTWTCTTVRISSFRAVSGASTKDATHWKNVSTDPQIYCEREWRECERRKERWRGMWFWNRNEIWAKCLLVEFF